jgi:carbohydrate binding protein with CBM4/9 domain
MVFSPRALVGAISSLALMWVPACTLQDFDVLSSEWVSIGAGQGGTQAGSGGVGGNGGASGSIDQGGAAGSSGNAGAGAGEPENLIVNPSFEAGHANWIGFGNSTILDVLSGAHSGDQCIASTNRTQSWEGPSFDALSIVTPGQVYQMGAWVRLDAGTPNGAAGDAGSADAGTPVVAPQAVALSFKSLCEGAPEVYTPIISMAVGTTWRFLQARLTVPDCTLNELRIYFEGPAPGRVFYVDDVSLLVGQ